MVPTGHCLIGALPLAKQLGRHRDGHSLLVERITTRRRHGACR
jgi:hypothetical protein